MASEGLSASAPAPGILSRVGVCSLGGGGVALESALKGTAHLVWVREHAAADFHNWKITFRLPRHPSAFAGGGLIVREYDFSALIRADQLGCICGNHKAMKSNEMPEASKQSTP
jgi:hypothetical protein